MPKTLPVDPCRAPIKRGRPRRETPYYYYYYYYYLCAASLRYRRSQKLKHQQQQLQFEELFRKNASLHSTQAKLEKTISVIASRVRQWADQGCAHCLQTALLLQPSSFPQQPMVKIEPEAFLDLKELHCS